MILKNKNTKFLFETMIYIELIESKGRCTGHTVHCKPDYLVYV
jgi:hypothetical protein